MQEEKWDKLYYAVVTLLEDKYTIWGIGSSKMSARNDAISLKLQRIENVPKHRRRKDVPENGFGKKGFENFVYGVSNADLNTFNKIRCDQSGKMGIVYCEAKIYIYGKRHGYSGMVVCLDPSYTSDLLRFVKYEKERRRRTI